MLVEPGNEHNHGFGLAGGQGAQDPETVQTRHLDIEENHIRTNLFDLFDCLQSVRCLTRDFDLGMRSQ